MPVKKLSILGSTGSIGTQALSLVKDLNIEISALSGYGNAKLLEEQALCFKPRAVCAVEAGAARDLRIKLAHTDIKVLGGREGLLEIASEPDESMVLNAVVGIAGLEPTLAASGAKKDVALANKETLVAAGELVRERVNETGVRLLPVDSEHSAIFQCLEGNRTQEISRIFLTASGGPFFGWSREMLADVSVEQALRHPNWVMGSKITVDSATMMNKGLELIEAMWLFDVDSRQIEITVHRQSVVHSMVEFKDRSVIAQLSVPDMRIPIQYALTYPRRLPVPVPALSIETLSKLTFEHPDFETFVCLGAAAEAAKKGGLAPAVANAANERAVELFLERKISFLDIGYTVERLVGDCRDTGGYSLEDVLAADNETRRKVDSVLGI